MNKKTLILSLAVIFTMSGINIVYAAESNADKSKVKNKIEKGCPESFSQRPDFGKFQCQHKEGQQHFKGHPDVFAPKHFEGRHPSPEEIRAKKAEIDKRLKLTDEQKQQIENQKQLDREKIKPIVEQIKVKKNEFKSVLEDESLSSADKDKKLKELKDSLRELKNQAETLRKENMANFESILTDKQKKEFSKIKEEQKKEMEQRRKQFEKQHCKKCS